MRKLSDHAIRMKAYEKLNSVSLRTKTPVLIRIDGKAFHSFCRGMNRPVDNRLVECLNQATKSTLEEIDGARVAYLQSDEISILLTDFTQDSTQGWFHYNKQKLESVIASMFTAYFNKNFTELFAEDIKHKEKIAFFDCRAWSLPFTEVNNYFWWRQKDCTKNAISMIARTMFSDKELHKKNTGEVQTLIEEKLGEGVDIRYPQHFLKGRCLSKNEEGVFTVDNNLPLFVNDRDYINKHIEDYFPETLRNVIHSIRENNVVYTDEYWMKDRESLRKINTELDLFENVLNRSTYIPINLKIGSTVNFLP